MADEQSEMDGRTKFPYESTTGGDKGSAGDNPMTLTVLGCGAYVNSRPISATPPTPQG